MVQLEKKFVYSVTRFDYNDGRLAVSEPGGTGATVDDLNFANVDAGKAYLFDVVSTPNLVKTYSASGISLPTPSVTSQPKCFG